jgi:hypothetical protein
MTIPAVSLYDLSSSLSSHRQLVYYTAAAEGNAAAAKVLIPLDQQQQQQQQQRPRPAVDPACLAHPSPSHPACPSFDSTFRVLMTSIIGPSTSSYNHSTVPAPIVRNHLTSSTTALNQRRPSLHPSNSNSHNSNSTQLLLSTCSHKTRKPPIDTTHNRSISSTEEEEEEDLFED